VKGHSIVVELLECYYQLVLIYTIVYRRVMSSSFVISVSPIIYINTGMRVSVKGLAYCGVLLSAGADIHNCANVMI